MSSSRPLRQPEGTDQEIVTEAIKALRRITRNYVRGGLDYEYRLAGVALEAFERLTDPQPVLWTEEG